MTWNRRTDLAELMDGAECSREELHRALVFLRFLNKWSLARRMIARGVRPEGATEPGRVLDVATGGADIPAYLLGRKLARLMVGVDRGGKTLAVARSLSPGVVLVRGDALRLPFADGAFDVAMCHLFFHHLTDAECRKALREMTRVAKRVVVLDLDRSRRLYWIVKAATRWSGSRLSRHDGPVSVRRAYTRSEIEALVRGMGLEVTIERRPCFRWSLT